ncbi:hypothetical protein Taro_017783, partial [Colocasia esculenta]|nr:hypothetical protein [Colocasia esculenta]
MCMVKASGALALVMLWECVVSEASVFVCVVSSTTPTVVTSSVGCPRFFVSQAVSSGLVPVLVLYHRDVTGPQLVLFPVPHSRELWPESLEVPGMGLWLCGPQVVVLVDLH